MASKLLFLAALFAPLAFAQDISLPVESLPTVFETSNELVPTSIGDLTMTLPVENLPTFTDGSAAPTSLSMDQSVDPRPSNVEGSMTLPVESLETSVVVEPTTTGGAGDSASETGAAAESSTTGGAPRPTGMMAAGVLGAVGAIGMAVL